METTALRTLDAIARSLGRPLPVREVVAEVRRSGAPGYYANTYHALRALEARGVLEPSKVGRSLGFSLRLGHPAPIDSLAELEIHRARAASEATPGAAAFLADLERELRHLPVEFACAGDLARGLRMRRFALLLGCRGTPAPRVLESILEVGRRSGIGIDALLLRADELPGLLAADAAHPIPEMLSTATAIHLPQLYWGRLCDAAQKGLALRFSPATDLARLPRGDLTYNLGRLGFPLLGAAERGRALCAEYTVTAALAARDARLRGGAAAVLERNAFDPRIMAFVASRHGLVGALLRALAGSGGSAAIRSLEALLQSAAGQGREGDASKSVRRKIHGR